MTLNTAQTLLYVADDQADTVDVISTATNTILERIPVVSALLPSSLTPPAGSSEKSGYKGANPNSVALSPDETQLYVTDGNLNCISVVALNGTNTGDHVIGLVPTGWYPNSVSFSGDGNTVYTINGKSPTGPNPDLVLWRLRAARRDQLVIGEYLQSPAGQGRPPNLPAPDRGATRAPDAAGGTNNRFSYTESDNDKAVMAAVRQGFSTSSSSSRKIELTIRFWAICRSATGSRVWPCSARRSRRISTTWRCSLSPSTISSTRPR